MAQTNLAHTLVVIPVSIDATLTFRELELMERKRYNELRLSATKAPSTAETKGAVR